jgi:hypothetical protein
MHALFGVAVLLLMTTAAQAMPTAPFSSAGHDSWFQVQMSAQKKGNKMSCKQMMRMHRDMMGNKKKKMTCKQMMRMHQEMMGKKM